jgi:hypothetical protein
MKTEVQNGMTQQEPWSEDSCQNLKRARERSSPRVHHANTALETP